MAHNHYDFQGKTILITGGGTGIGAAIARAFLDNGASVAVTGRRREPLRQVLGAYSSERGLAVTSDVSDPTSAKRLVTAVTDRFGAIDVVVTSAAAYTTGHVTEVGLEQWHAIRDTNIDGFFHLAQAVLPLLMVTKGNLVAISSVSGIRGDWGQAVYNASKHAVNGFVTSLALDYGWRGVRINAVAPAFTLTDATAGFGTDGKSLAPYVNRVALGRPARPEDIAPAVLFLASEDAAYITGTVLTVDGGTSASTGQPHIE
jgi:meso-butanediol dehydrogenase / (S,S)-butanediol dehydrogenase / diacetyl reductase